MNKDVLLEINLVSGENIRAIVHSKISNSYIKKIIRYNDILVLNSQDENDTIILRGSEILTFKIFS